jgi:hypothetical protein
MNQFQCGYEHLPRASTHLNTYDKQEKTFEPKKSSEPKSRFQKWSQFLEINIMFFSLSI